MWKYLQLMKDVGPVWADVVDHWDELTKLIDNGKDDEVTQLLRRFEGNFHAMDPLEY